MVEPGQIHRSNPGIAKDEKKSVPASLFWRVIERCGIQGTLLFLLLRSWKPREKMAKMSTMVWRGGSLPSTPQTLFLATSLVVLAVPPHFCLKKGDRFWFPEASPRGRNVRCTPPHVSPPAISLFLSFAFSPQSISRLLRINLREIECKRQRCTHGRLEGRKAGRGNLIYGIIYFTMKGRGLRNPLTTTGQEGKGEEILTIVEIEKEREKGGRKEAK